MAIGALRDTWCRAAANHLYLTPWGEVRACCQQQRSLGYITTHSLLDIWRGSRRAELVGRLQRSDLRDGCQSCADEAAIEGRAASYAASFDGLEPASSPGWPSSIEFNLSDRCNLQCIQCSADLSSSIRAHQTDLPPLGVVYDDRFFTDLREFVPHLRKVQVAGGEPFLAHESYRLWDLLAELAPGVTCTTVTNGTIWTQRVEDVLERLPMNIVVSLDGITAGTFEGIRRGAHLGRVLANLDRFAATCRAAGTSISINHCLMVQNVHEFGDLLVYAADRDIDCQVSVVHGPEDCALPSLGADRLADIADRLHAQEDELVPRLGRNLATWRRELDRIDRWAQAGEGALAAAYASSRYGQIEGFPRQAAPGPASEADVASERAVLAGFADDHTVHEVRIGPGELISGCSDGFERLLGVEPGSLQGRPARDLQDLSAGAFGRPTSAAFDEPVGDRRRGATSYSSMEARFVLLPLRDEAGWSDQVLMMLAFCRT